MANAWTPGDSLLNRLVSVFVESPVEAAVVGLFIAPTFIACLAAGATWERLLRRIGRRPTDLGPRTSAYAELAKLIAIYGVLACLASLAMHVILASITGGNGSD